MSLTTAFALPCENNTGGLVSLYLTDKANVSSFTESGGEWTAVTMNSSAVFYQYEFEQDMAEYTNPASRENSSTLVNHNIEFYLTKMTTLQRNAIQAIFDSSTCGIVAIAEDANNNKWVVGYSSNFGTARPLKIASTEGGTGKAFTDGNGTTVNMASSDNELAKVFIGTVPV